MMCCMEKKVFRAITCLTQTLFLLSHMTRGTASPQTSLGEDADLQFQLPHALFEVVILFGKPCNLRFQFF